ncbi:MAG: cytochrome P460 family protein [Planctomycetota bacterium]
MIRCTFPLLAAAVLVGQAPLSPPSSPPPAPGAVAAKTGSRAVDLAICLDISGSMDGLINAARQNLWAVVNDLARLQPTPTLRVALLTFGCTTHDAEKGWVKVETGFTTDLDLVSQKLFALTTNGGDEYVARVMQAALGELQWTPDSQALKLLFVAGNESAQQDKAVDLLAICKAAIGQGIVVNSIYCGNPADELAPAWREIAKSADGKFAAIDKDNAVVIVTPFDEQLTALSAAMNPTFVPYGAQRAYWVGNQAAQDSNAASLNPAAAAQRGQTKACDLYCNSHWDLVDACADPKFKLEDVKKDDLPEALRALSIADLRAHIATQKQKRGEVQAQIMALGKQRDAFVLAEQTKRAVSGDKLFEQAVLESVREQAAARGFQRRPEEPAPAPAPAPTPKQDVESPFTKVIKDAAAEYRKFVRVTGEPHVAPTDCRMPAPLVRKSEAGDEHGKKLYLLYARQADGVQYVKAGEPAKVGQTLVKEAWQCVDGEPKAATAASRRYGEVPVLRDGAATCHAGDFHGLFVMHKLAADTKDTDQGWVYGTVDRDGVVTGAGRMASCMRCHEGATEDRRFGLR